MSSKEVWLKLCFIYEQKAKYIWIMILSLKALKDIIKDIN